ncbi:MULTISPECIES: TenA family protein [Micrococcales]|uniref:TenA family protein n=1 Tax=Micrococcales TaxID=85006 RepID=UPI0004ABA8E2|nr:MULTISPECIES: TenA family protein [Micrococcales]
MNETIWRTGPFTGRLWSDAAEILARVGELRFLAELADGTLDPGVFVHYIQQDEFYLANYSRAMAVLASRAPTSDAAEFWAGSASSAVAEEKILHEQLLGDERLSGHSVPEVPSATTRGYMYTLLAACAYEPYEVGAAAVLPCFWIYADVGRRLAGRATEIADHPYGQWVMEYGDPAFAEATQRAIDVVEEAAAAATEPVRERMREVFLDASRYEELFWDAAHRRESWSL